MAQKFRANYYFRVDNLDFPRKSTGLVTNVTGSIKCEYVRAFPNHPSAKDLDLLRDADADLEKRISQLSFLRLALVVILTFMFASALHRRNEGTIKNVDTSWQISRSRTLSILIFLVF
jgi:hypothetical protein